MAALTAYVRLADEKGPGKHGAGIFVGAITAAGVAQTVQLAPYKLTDPDNTMWIRGSGASDTAGAATVDSVAADGKSITFTPASTGQIQLFLAGPVAMQP